MLILEWYIHTYVDLITSIRSTVHTCIHSYIHLYLCVYTDKTLKESWTVLCKGNHKVCCVRTKFFSLSKIILLLCLNSNSHITNPPQAYCVCHLPITLPYTNSPRLMKWQRSTTPTEWTRCFFSLPTPRLAYLLPPATINGKLLARY